MISSLQSFGLSILPFHTISLDVELPSNEAILEAMTMDDRSWEDTHYKLFIFPKIETLEVDYQINLWPDPSNELYLNK